MVQAAGSKRLSDFARGQAESMIRTTYPIKINKGTIEIIEENALSQGTTASTLTVVESPLHPKQSYAVIQRDGMSSSIHLRLTERY